MLQNPQNSNLNIRLKEGKQASKYRFLNLKFPPKTAQKLQNMKIKNGQITTKQKMPTANIAYT
tara:strand:- start:1022 stop:1210 length:189 start_codon:yes stop_codon:yes gene_type:complete